jgi:hypothetical protein
MERIAKGFAKAETPFGPLSGHTNIDVVDQGNDSAVIMFRCGHTPVTLAVAGDNYRQLLNALIDKATPAEAEKYRERLDHILKATA